MSEFYNELAKIAADLLKEFGAPITLSRRINEEVSPIYGVVDAGDDASITTTGIFSRPKNGAVNGIRLVAGEQVLILTGEQRPLMSDRPVINGQSFTIKDIEKISPDNTVDIVYFVKVSK